MPIVIMMQLITNKGGYMKIPSLRSIERMIKMAPIIKDVFTPTPTESESKSQISKLEDAVHNKNAAIFKLRQERKAMKRLIFSSNTRIKDLEKQVWGLEENLDNCKHEMERMQLTLTKEGL